jgi:hypothetical protein
MRVRVPTDVPTCLVSVSIRQREYARLVAVIELLSPVNKRRGKGRDEYLEKRRTFLTSPVHLIEIDLPRSYPRMPFDDPLPPAYERNNGYVISSETDIRQSFVTHC